MSDGPRHLAEDVVLEGADALSYLDSQCTQDLAGLEAGAVASTFVLDPTGELVTVATVRRVDGTGVALQVPARHGGADGGATPSLRDPAGRHRRTTPSRSRARTPLRSELERIDAGVPGAARAGARARAPRGRARLLERAVSRSRRAATRARSWSRACRHAARRRPTCCAASSPTRRSPPATPWGRSASTASSRPSPEDPAGGQCHGLCVLHRRDAEGATVEVRTAAGIVVARLPLGTVGTLGT